VPADTGLAGRAEELRRARVPYVQATVVRALHPTSAHAGDTALVHGDGVIEGFVGGTCAESSVRRFALDVLVSGEPLLLRVTAGAPGEVQEEGVVTVANPCLSGGSLEVFLEPVVPPARLVVVGETPVAAALVALGGPLGFAVEAGPSAGDVAGAAAVVVASHGRGEEPALEAALAAGVPYVGLVASQVRAAAVLGSLAAPDADRVHSPAGLDLGCRTAPEIALSILAQVVATRSAARPAEPVAVEPTTALDPVCGMTVAVSAAVPQAEIAGVTTYFCCEPCRAAYVAEPERYA
jgi:xanthine dehydrogenase accessory factor